MVVISLFMVVIQQPVVVFAEILFELVFGKGNRICNPATKQLSTEYSILLNRSRKLPVLLANLFL